MGDAADWVTENGELGDLFDEFYEERLVLDALGDGLSVSAVAAKYNLTVDDVIEIKAWAKRF